MSNSQSFNLVLERRHLGESPKGSPKGAPKGAPNGVPKGAPNGALKV